MLLPNRVIAFLLAVLFVSSGCGGGSGGGGTETGSCGALGIRVFGGSECTANEGPVVAIVPVDVNGDRIDALGLCTGTLVTLDDVLTAAHCVTVDADALVVVAGGDAYRVIGGEIHPLYNGEEHDLAMLTLDRPTNIGPVPLGLSVPLSIGDRITAFGYGQSEDPEIGLRAAELEISGFGPNVFVTSFDSTNAAICQGDSGGPVTLTLDGITGVVGVTSVTIRGCESGSFSGFMNLQAPVHRDFILRYAADISTL